MSIIRVGTNKNYAEGWETIFGSKSKRRPAKKVAAKKARKPAKRSKKAKRR